MNQICIIGVGLIGSSLALALKRCDSSVRIIGCSKTQKTIDIAKSLSIIDDGYTNSIDAVKDADIIVLCTPLSTYSTITEQIAPYIKEGAIITDVGSVKYKPSLEIINQLKESQKAFFIPAHPIAGTEKSGPEAGFSELFEGKKVIITPLSFADKNAVNMIKKMWGITGAEIMEMDAKIHDIEYARVSHNIQFLSYAFGLLLQELNEDICSEIKNNCDINFKKFIRLINSDPIMWHDIFIVNKDNLLESIEMFQSNLMLLRKNIMANNIKNLEEIFKKAFDKRMSFHKVHKGEIKSDFRESNYSNLSPDAFAYMSLLPMLIGSAIMLGTEESEYKFAAGAGFHGFTKNVILPSSETIDSLFKDSKKIVKVIDEYISKTNCLMSLIYSEDKNLVEKISAIRKFI